MIKFMSHKAHRQWNWIALGGLLPLCAAGLGACTGILTPFAADDEATDPLSGASAQADINSRKDVKTRGDADASGSYDTLKPLRVSGNGRYLVDSSGAPFFWAGDCAWALHTRASFNVSVPGTDGQNEVDYYLSARASQGYTVIHTWLIPGWQAENTDGDRPLRSRLDQDSVVVLNEAFFNNVNKVLERAAHHRLYVAIELGHVLRQNAGDLYLGGISSHSARQARAYEYGWKVAQALAGHDNLIWGFGQDTVPTRANRVGADLAADDAAKYKDLIRAMAEGVADGTNAPGATFAASGFDSKADYSTTLMTFHTGATRNSDPVGTSSSEWFHDEAWLDLNMRQGGRNKRYKNAWYTLAAQDYSLEPPKPTVEGEAAYEGSAHQGGTISAYDTRVAGYWGVFSGSAGYNYGHLSVWQLYGKDYAARSSAKANWYDAIKADGATQMQHLRRLITSRPQLERLPDQSLVASDAGSGHRRLLATRDDRSSYLMVYVTNGRSFDVNLAKLSGDRLNAWWFNPRNGKTYDADGIQSTKPFARFNAKGVQTFDPPGVPSARASTTGNDWVLIVDDAAASYGIPGTWGAPEAADLHVTRAAY